jgi:hypothetical protein
MFVDKAKAAQDAGAAMVIVMSDENMIMNMSSDESNEIGATIRIPTVLITKSVASILAKAVQSAEVKVGVRRELKPVNPLENLLSSLGGAGGGGVQMMDIRCVCVCERENRRDLVSRQGAWNVLLLLIAVLLHGYVRVGLMLW